MTFHSTALRCPEGGAVFSLWAKSCPTLVFHSCYQIFLPSPVSPVSSFCVYHIQNRGLPLPVVTAMLREEAGHGVWEVGAQFTRPPKVRSAL